MVNYWKLLHISKNQIIGKENSGDNNKLRLVMPVKLYNENLIDIISIIDTKSEDKKEKVLYSIISK